MFPVWSVISCCVAFVSLVNSGELEYPEVKYCPVVNPCQTPLLYNVEYRCGFDEGCSLGYKCCKTDCYIHKVCVVPVDKNGDKIQPPTEAATDSTDKQSSENDVKEWPTPSFTIMSKETNTATELRNVTEVFPTLTTILENFSSSTLETTMSEHRQLYSHTTDKNAPTANIRIGSLIDNYTNLDNTSERIVINTSTVSAREEENQDNFTTITEKESTNVQEVNVFARLPAISFSEPHNFVKLKPAPKWIGIEGSGGDITTDDEDGFTGSGRGSGDDEGSGLIDENIGLTKEDHFPNTPEYEFSDTDHHSTTEDVTTITTTDIPTSSPEHVEGSGYDTESTSDLSTFTDDEDVFEGSGYQTSSHETAGTYPSSNEWNTSIDDFYRTTDGNGINTDSSLYDGSSTSNGGTYFWGSTDIGEGASSDHISTDDDIIHFPNEVSTDKIRSENPGRATDIGQSPSSDHISTNDDTIHFANEVSTDKIRPENPSTSHDDVYFPNEFSDEDETSEGSFSTNTIDITKSSDPKITAEGSGDTFNDDETRNDEDDDDDGEITTLPTFDTTKSANETSNLSFKASSLHSYPIGVNDNVTYEEEDDEEDGDGVDEDIRNNFQGKSIKG